MTKIRILAAGAAAAAACAAQAAVMEVEAEADIRVATAHLWRGQVINDEACFQPSVTVFAGELMFNVWGTWDITDVTNRTAHTRVDVSLDYSYHVGRQLFNPGMIAYLYQDAPGRESKDTFEAFLGYALDVPLLPALTVYYDFGEIEGFYATASLAHSFELRKDQIDLDLSVCVGAGDEAYNQAVFGNGNGGDSGAPESGPAAADIEASVVDFTATAYLPITVPLSEATREAGVERLAVVPGVKYMSLIDSNLREAVKSAGGKESEVAGSLALMIRF